MPTAEDIKNKLIKVSSFLERAAYFLKAKSLLFLKSEIAKIGAVIFFIAIILTTITPLLLNNASLKFHLSQKLTQMLGSNLVIKGDVDIALLPSPKIILHEVVLQNYQPKISKLDSPKIYDFYAKSVEVIFPIFDLVGGISVTEIIFNDAILESHFDNPSLAKRQDDLVDILNKFDKEENLKQAPESGIGDLLFSIDDLKIIEMTSSKIPDISIRNGQRIIYDFFGRKREIKAININLLMSGKKFAAEGSFNSDNITSNFEIFAKFNSSSKKPKSFIKITSPVLNFNFSGNFTSENHLLKKGLLEHDFKGEITAEIAELKSFYRSYIDDSDLLSEKLKYNGKPISISAEIENKSNEGLVKNLKITSNLIEGSGEINLSRNKKTPLIDIDLAVENLDLDSILSGDMVTNDVAKTDENKKIPDDILAEKTSEDLAKSEDQTATEPIKTINLDLTKRIKDFDLTAEIKVKNTKYLNGQITDANLYLIISKQGEVLIMPLIFKIPGEGILRVNGAIDNSTATTKFIGKIDATGKNLGEIFKWLQLQSQNLKLENLKSYNLYSDVLLLPNSISLNNLYLGLNNNSSQVVGEIKIDNGGKVLNTNNHLQISHFDVDDYFFTSGQNIYLSPGLLLKKVLWLNNLSSNNNFDLSFDKLIYGDEIFLNQTIKLRFGPGYFDLYEADLKSQKTALKLNIALDIRNQDPHFDLKIDSEKFDYKTPQQKDKTAEVKTNRNFFDQFYALPSLEEFGGKIVLNFVDLTLNEVALKNLKLSGTLKDGNLTNADFICGIYEGELGYKGMLGLKLNKTINGNLYFNNATLKPLLSDIFGIQNISGIANFTANVTSVADSKIGFSKALTSEVKFIVNSPSVEGYGLTDLVKKMFAAPNYLEELRNPEKILENTNSQTSFKQAKGSFQISGGQGGKIKIDLNASALNAILSGGLDPTNNTIDSLLNIIFLTGNTQKQTPINIATSIKGKTNNIFQSTNLDQVRQYLKLPKIVRAPVAENSDKTLPANVATENTPEQNSQLVPAQLSIQRPTEMPPQSSIQNPPRTQ